MTDDDDDDNDDDDGGGGGFNTTLIRRTSGRNLKTSQKAGKHWIDKYMFHTVDASKRLVRDRRGALFFPIPRTSSFHHPHPDKPHHNTRHCFK
jgi:hypothetical protein